MKILLRTLLGFSFNIDFNYMQVFLLFANDIYSIVTITVNHCEHVTSGFYSHNDVALNGVNRGDFWLAPVINSIARFAVAEFCSV